MRNAIEILWQDVRYALRIFLKTPLITSVALLSLALGIGANTAIFSLIDTVMLRVLPVQKPEELLQVVMRNPRGGHEPLSYYTNPLWEQIRDHQDVFSSAFAWGSDRFDLALGGEKQYVSSILASGEYFNTLGVRPATGRLFSADDDKRGCPGVAVLSYGYWQEHYGGAPDAVGKSVSLNGFPFQVIGVSASGFFGVDVGDHFDVAVPLCTEAILSGKNSMLDQRSAWWIRVIGRLKPGMQESQAAARLQAASPEILAGAVPQNWKPEMQKNFLQRTLLTRPAALGVSFLRQEYDKPLKILMSVVGLVLLIACANIASLMLARSAARQKEIAVRLAVGASRSRLIRQLLTECILLSSAGALLGFLFARWGDAILVRFLSTPQEQVFLDLSLDRRVFGFTAGIAVLTGLLFGLLPAIRSTKVSLSAAMKGGHGDEGAGRGRFRPGRWIVASQVALSLVLLVGAGLFLRSFHNLLTLDLGFDRNNVLIVQTDIHKAKVSPEQRGALFDQLLNRVQGLPGVISASQSVLTPIGRRTWNNALLVDEPGAPKGDDAITYINWVSPEYFTTLRSPLVIGRNFDTRDIAGAPRVAIVNETLASRFFPGSNAIGKYFKMEEGPNGLTPPIQIVGILKDAKYQDLRESILPTTYFPSAQLVRAGGFVSESTIIEIRTASQPSSMAHSVAEAMTAVNSSVSIEFRTLAQQVDDSLTSDRLLATLSGFFGGLALFLAMIGLYGVLAYIVTQRQKEIGIRMALGAEPGSILRLVMRDVAVLLLVGIAVGTAIAAGTTRFVQKLLFGLAPHDTTTIAIAVCVMAVVAMIAGFVPARRAAKLDPMAVLRDE
jgi:putative ABC transport system permease protein